MHTRAILASLVLVTALAGCSTDDDAAAQGSQQDDLTWEPVDCPDDVPEGDVCAEDTEIAQVEVPLDHDDPENGTVMLSVARRRAAKPEERIGALFINPGGPGGSAVEAVTFFEPNAEIRDRFDLIGFDPRGVGRSEPFDCGIPAKELIGVDLIVDSAHEAELLVDSAQRFADACQSQQPQLLAHMGTWDAARDMDRVRSILGEDTLSYLGYSYGTAIGQVYAALFPDRVRAMALDGVDDITKSAVDANTSAALASEQALQTFVDQCTQQPDCPLNPDPLAVIDQVQASTQRAPIPAPDADRPLGPGEHNWGALLPLYAPDVWPQFAQALASAHSGDGSQLVGLLDEFLTSSNLDVAFAVECLDKPVTRGDTQSVLDAAHATGLQAPHFGEAWVNRSMYCALWSAPAQPLAPLDLSRTPPVVVVSTTNDPATPYQAGVALAEQLPQGGLITYQGNGHTIYGQGNACVDQAVEAYLLDPTGQVNDMTCT